MNESKKYLHLGPKLTFPDYATAYGLTCYQVLNRVIRASDVERPNILETVQSLLPCTIAFDSYLDASEDHFLTASEINSKLNNIPVVEWPRS